MARVEIERSRAIAASSATVWDRCYGDAAAWPEWNRELASAELEGPFESGTSARVRFKSGLRLRFRLTEVDPGRVFTDVARLPGARMGHRHVLEPAQGGTIYFDGPLARPWARLMGARAASALEEGQRRIAALTTQGTNTP